MMGLTHSQAKVLAVIKRLFAEHRCAPSIAEIMAETGTTSQGSMHKMLNALEERGHIRRKHWQPRSIRLVKRRGPRRPRYQFIPLSALTWPVRDAA